MAVDDFSLLPEAPPPRPSRRDAAIDTALRRFDGIEELTQPASQRARWAFGQRPQFGALVTASLLLVLGIPAAMIALGDEQVNPPRAEVTARAPQPAAPAADAAADTQGDVAEEASTATVPAPPVRFAPDRLPVLPDDLARQSAPAAETDAVDAGAPPPAAPVASPAPPPPSPVAEAEAQGGDSQIVVTGSMIRRPPLLSENSQIGKAKRRSEEKASNETPAAPDWVMRDASYRTFLSDLQAAVRADNRRRVTALIRYPLRVNAGGAQVHYRDSTAVLAAYDRIFTARVRSAILAQRTERLFGSDQGVMIGDGAVWFEHSCRNRACSPVGPVKIFAINP